MLSYGATQLEMRARWREREVGLLHNTDQANFIGGPLISINRKLIAVIATAATIATSLNHILCFNTLLKWFMEQLNHRIIDS